MFQFTRFKWAFQDQSSFVNSPGHFADFHALSSNAKTSPVSPYQLDQMYPRLELTNNNQTQPEGRTELPSTHSETR